MQAHRQGEAGGRRRFLQRVRSRAGPAAAAPAGGAAASGGAGPPLDWPQVLEQLRVVRHRWDLAILCHLDEERGSRPADLLAAINRRSGSRQLAPQVLSVRLRALEQDGYVQHADLTRIPLLRVYTLLPPGRAMLRTLHSLAPWDSRMPDRRSLPPGTARRA